MKPAQNTMLDILSCSLFGNIDIIAEIEDSDIDEILMEAKSQAVFGIVYDYLKRNYKSEQVLKKWDNIFVALLANNVRINRYHEILHEWMTEAGVPYVILKGCASASYYTCPINRTMGDVDFLVHEDYIEKAEKVLKSHALIPGSREHVSHIVYRKNNMRLELHFQIAGMPDGEKKKIIRGYLKDIYDSSKNYKTGNGQMMIPSDFHHGIIILLHTYHHLTGEGIGLRHLCDWAVFVNSMSSEKFIELFEKKLRMVGLWRFAQILTLLSVRYLGVEPRKWAEIENCHELLENLLQDILVSGNFGVNDYERSNQSYIISSRGKNGVGKTGIPMQLIYSLNNVVYARWKFAKRWKIVLPAGWIYFGVKQLIKIKKGKRKKVHLGKTLSGAIARKKIYSQLYLYDTENQ